MWATDVVGRSYCTSSLLGGGGGEGGGGVEKLLVKEKLISEGVIHVVS